jgi:hypothetical protein
MTIESMPPVNGAANQSPLERVQTPSTASAWKGRTIGPLAAKAIGVLALAALLPTAAAYGEYYKGQTCDFYNCYDVFCHLEEACRLNFLGFLGCHIEEVCNYY